MEKVQTVDKPFSQKFRREGELEMEPPGLPFLLKQDNVHNLLKRL